MKNLVLLGTPRLTGGNSWTGGRATTYQKNRGDMYRMNSLMSVRFVYEYGSERSVLEVNGRSSGGGICLWAYNTHQQDACRTG